MLDNRIRSLTEILQMLQEAAELPGYFDIGPEEAKILFDYLTSTLQFTSDAGERQRVDCVLNFTPVLVAAQAGFGTIGKIVQEQLQQGKSVFCKLSKP